MTITVHVTEWIKLILGIKCLPPFSCKSWHRLWFAYAAHRSKHHSGVHDHPNGIFRTQSPVCTKREYSRQIILWSQNSPLPYYPGFGSEWSIRVLYWECPSFWPKIDIVTSHENIITLYLAMPFDFKFYMGTRGSLWRHKVSQTGL